MKTLKESNERSPKIAMNNIGRSGPKLDLAVNVCQGAMAFIKCAKDLVP